jgi:nucleoside-diphosphate-sugar epimerase
VARSLPLTAGGTPTGHDDAVHLLILGGTWFVGRTIAEAAVRRGWDVTCFNRGRTGREVTGVETVRGDRTDRDDVTKLAQLGPWDAVVDTSAYEPLDVTRVANALADSARSYALMSTVSAYRHWPGQPTTEGSPLWPARRDARETDPDVATLPRPFRYGTLKAGCELAVGDVFEKRAVILRPGVVLGPHEYVGRLESLLNRAARGGPMLAAGDPRCPVQPVDVRDLAAFTLRLVEAERHGTFNVVAPRGHATYGDLLDACVAATGDGAELVWVDPSWLADHGVREWTELVLWRSPAGTWEVDGTRAQVAGLTCRPLSMTVADTWAWLQNEQPVPHPRAAEHGLKPEREAALLAAWDTELARRCR